MSSLIRTQNQKEDYETHSGTGDYFKIWPEPTKNPNQESLTGASIFSILIKHTTIYCPEHYSSRAYNPNDFDKEDPTLEVERDLLMNGDTLVLRFILEDKLMDLDIPSWPSMIDNILKCARDMARNKEFESYKVLHMHARVDTNTIIDESDELFSEHDEDEIAEFPDDVEMEPVRVPAIESAIQKLEMIKIEDQPRSCVVCLEEILFESQATRMPCAHIFHGDCILNWLSKNNFCPLCRFELD